MATVVHARELSLEAVSPRLVPNDSVLTPAEKPKAVQDYNVIIVEQSGIVTQASSYPTVSGELSTYNNAVTALTTYLNTLTGWNTIPGTYVAIIGTTYRSKWEDVYTTKQALLNAINLFISPTISPSGPPDVPSSLVAAAEPFGIRITIVPPAITQFISHYEYRVGASWDVGTVLEKVGGTSYLWKVQDLGTKTFWVRSVNTSGTYSTTSATNSVTISGGTVSTLQTATRGQAVSFSWNSTPGSYAIAGYEVRYWDSSMAGINEWGSALVVDFRQVNTYTTPGVWLGDRTYYIAAIDVFGNTGTSGSIIATIATPQTVTGIRAETVDNNVLLYWNPIPINGLNELDIRYYEVRKGTTWAGGTLIGSNGNSTFTSYFEQSAGVFKYWIAAVDSAGNYGAAASISATVTQPPDYIFQSSYDSDLLGGDPAGMAVTQTLSNFYYENAHIIGPVATDATWDVHFNNTKVSAMTVVSGGTGYAVNDTFRLNTGTAVAHATGKVLAVSSGVITSILLTYPGNYTANPSASGATTTLTGSGSSLTITPTMLGPWASPQAQITAGYPIYNQPPLTQGYYEEVLDYSTAVPSTVVTLTTGLEVITGSVTTETIISWKLNLGDSWTDLTPDVLTSIVPSFRYLKIRYNFSCTTSANLIQINSINVTLAVKSRTDSGVVSAASGYNQTTGVVVTFAYPFISANTPMVSINASAAYVPVIVYTGGTNPTGFSVHIWGIGGTELGTNSAYNFSWTVQGY